MTEKEIVQPDVVDEHVLDLDAIFGVEQPPIIVRWQGEEYELTRPEALNAEQLLKYGKLSEMAAQLQTAKSHSAPKIERALQQLIEVISPELAKQDLTFLHKSRVMQFYNEQLEASAHAEEEGDEESNPTEPAPEPVEEGA